MSFYAKDSTVTFCWGIAPIAVPPVKADFDITLVLPNGTVTYIDDGITTFIAPTATTQGQATYDLTLANVGLHQITLSIGTAAVHIIDAYREIYSVIPPVSVTGGAAPTLTQGPQVIPPIPGMILVQTMTSPSELTSDQYGCAADITDTHLAIGWLSNVDIFNTDGTLLRTINNSDFGIPTVISLNSTHVLITYSFYDDGNTGAGRAWVYLLSTGALVHTINNPNFFGTTLNDSFGNAAGMSEDFIIIAARNEESAIGQISAGAVYIFSTSTGLITQTLVDPDPNPNQEFGSGAAISASYACVGKRNAAGAGKVHIFNPSTGTLLRTIDNPITPATNFADFGYSVAVTETHLLVGAPGENTGAQQSGAAYVFNPSDGSLIWSFDDPNVHGTPNFDRFAEGALGQPGVSLSSKYALVNAHKEEGPAAEILAGVAYVFNLGTGLLEFTLLNPNDFGTENGDNFSKSVGITNTRAIICAQGEDSPSSQFSTGRAYRYEIIS